MPKSVPIPVELAQRIASVMHYDPETGEFTRPDRRPGHIGSMRVSGWINAAGYRMFAFEGRDFLSHRVAWVIMHGQDPVALHIDHINGNRADNRIENLRAVTQSVNMQNIRGEYRSNTSGYLGVCWSKDKSKWSVHIRLEGRYKFLGYFDNPEAASQVYLEAKRRLHPGCTI